MHTLKKIYSVSEFRFFFLILFLFSLLRLPALFEPNWYGDEGIYQVLGRAINQGKILYSQIWDNKPPLLYLTYALVNADQFWIRFLSYLAGLFAVVGFYLLTKKLFAKEIVHLLITALFAFLFAIPSTEANIANAENFMLVFIIFSGLLVYGAAENHGKGASQNLLLAGILLAIAFLYKIVAAFDFAAFFLFLLFLNLPKNVSLQRSLLSTIKKLSPMLIGFLLPVVLVALYFLFQGAFMTFFSATLSTNISYVGQKNFFFVPQGLLLGKIAILILSLYLLFRKRHSLSKQALFILLWFVFSLFNMFFSQRPYTHYVLVGLASFSLFLGLIISDRSHRFFFSALFLGCSLLTVLTFRPNPIKPFTYYPNFFSFIIQQKSLQAYQAYFDPETPRDYEIAMFLKNQMKDPGGTIFVWGDSAQIYTLSNTLPPGRYTVAYHIVSQKALSETQQAIDTKKPQFLILLPESPLPQLLLTPYLYKATIGDATIYERAL